MSDTPEPKRTPQENKDEALLFTLEVEKLGKKAKLPYLLIVGIPESDGGCIRSSLALKANLDVIEYQTLDYFRKFHQNQIKPE